MTQPSPDVLRERLIASRAAEYIEQQKASGVPRVNIDSEASSIVAKLIATDAVIAELVAQRIELIARFRVLLAEHLNNGQPSAGGAYVSAAVLSFSRRSSGTDDPDLVS